MPIVSQSENVIIERLSKYNRTLTAGINIILPVVERAKDTITRRQNETLTRSLRIDMREQVYDFDKQSVIIKDNVMTEINALLYFQIVDPMKAVYSVDLPFNTLKSFTIKPNNPMINAGARLSVLF